MSPHSAPSVHLSPVFTTKEYKERKAAPFPFRPVPCLLSCSFVLFRGETFRNLFHESQIPATPSTAPCSTRVIAFVR
jgi:hypothetical protein